MEKQLIDSFFAVTAHNLEANQKTKQMKRHGR